MLALLMVSADFCSDDGRRTLENAWNRRSGCIFGYLYRPRQDGGRLV